jgi:hypothetical protein
LLFGMAVAVRPSAGAIACARRSETEHEVTDAVTPIAAKAAGQWWVQVRGAAYGPYGRDQLSAFLAEGRIRPGTLVSNRRDGAWVEARRVIGLMQAAEAEAPTANVFVHAEIMSGSWNGFMAALEVMGAVCDLAPGLWLIRTRLSASTIRNTLSQTLERGDRIIVVDASRDRLAWFNLGMETDARIARVWNGPDRAERAANAS